MTLQSCSENTGAPKRAGRFVTLNLTFLTPSASFTWAAFLGAFVNRGPDPSVNATHATQLVKILEDRGSAEMCWGGRLEMLLVSSAVKKGDFHFHREGRSEGCPERKRSGAGCTEVTPPVTDRRTEEAFLTLSAGWRGGNSYGSPAASLACFSLCLPGTVAPCLAG